MGCVVFVDAACVGCDNVSRSRRGFPSSYQQLDFHREFIMDNWYLSYRCKTEEEQKRNQSFEMECTMQMCNSGTFQKCEWCIRVFKWEWHIGVKYIHK